MVLFSSNILDCDDNNSIHLNLFTVEKAGGKALPCIVDVRDESQVVNAVESAVKKFGGIDVLINNASAISLTNTLSTEMKRYDLMNNINTRGTFLVYVLDDLFLQQNYIFIFMQK